jgi:hypothetical protein
LTQVRRNSSRIQAKGHSAKLDRMLSEVTTPDSATDSQAASPEPAWLPSLPRFEDVVELKADQEALAVILISHTSEEYDTKRKHE